MVTSSQGTEPKGTRKDNGDGTVYLRKDGKWCAQILIPALNKRKTFYGKTEAEAKRKLKEFKRTVGGTQQQSVSSTTLSDYMTSWLYMYKKPLLKPASFDRLERTISAHITPTIGFIQISNLVADDIQGLLNKMQAEKNSLSGIKKVYNALNGCMKQAVIKCDLVKNPCLGVVLPTESQIPKKEIRILTKDEIEKLKVELQRKYATGNKVYYLPEIFLFILNTGLRMGEVEALMWNDIDLKNKNMKISRNAQLIKKRSSDGKIESGYELIVQKSTKTKSGERIVPLNNTAISCLESAKTITGDYQYVFANSCGEVMSPNHLRKKFDAVIKNAEIPHCGLHALRHTFASQLFERGVDIKIISELLGHANVNITYNVYITLIKDQKQKAITLLDEI